MAGYRIRSRVPEVLLIVSLRTFKPRGPGATFF